MSNTPMSKEGKRFDWYPLLDLQFLDDCIVNVSELTVSTLRAKSTRGVNAKKQLDSVNELVKQVINSLYFATTAPVSSSLVSIPLGGSYYKAKSPKTNQIKGNVNHVQAVISTLKGLGYINIYEGNEQKGFTRIEATGDLRAKFLDKGLVWLPQTPNPPEKLIVLRDVKRNKDGKVIRNKGRNSYKVDLELPKTEEVLRYQNNLYKINSFLVKQCISLDVDDHALSAIQAEMSASDNVVDNNQADSFDPRNVQLRRIFSRGSLEKGGRFYGGWWQSIPEKYRPLIRINDKKTIEIDYSGIGINMLYAQAGIQLDSSYDVYDLGLWNYDSKDDPRRKLVKKIFNALINDEDQVYRYPVNALNNYGVSKDQFINALETTHKPIIDKLKSGAGLYSQFKDSQIAETIMLWFVNEGIVCLPIHDSFIVPVGYAQYLEVAMKAAYKDVIGSDIKVEKGIVKTKEQFELSSKEIATIQGQGLVPDIRLSSYDLVRAQSIMDHFSFHRDVAT